MRNNEQTTHEMKYLSLLASQYPTVQAASSEIINLHAILNLPKGTEHFISDLHGEYTSLGHILRNASGIIKTKINILFDSSTTEHERSTLATLIYYPEQKLEHIKRQPGDLNEWYRLTLYRLIEVCREISSKYTRSKMRKQLPPDFAYIIDEMVNFNEGCTDKYKYHDQIIRSIIATHRADAFIKALAELIRSLAVDRLHILGDIYDRGPRPDLIVDELMSLRQVDIQWGNHDIVWLGAAAGSLPCIAEVLTTSIKYGNMDALEDAYGINLRPLTTFALDAYADDPCEGFATRTVNEERVSEDKLLLAKMHKAIFVIRQKLEEQLILRRPEYGMEERLLLQSIDFVEGTVVSHGKTYPLNDKSFPTVDPQNPNALTEEERTVIQRLQHSFLHSERLQQHMRFLLDKGSMYLICNGNLLYHGCIPINDDGELISGILHGGRGRDYLDFCEKMVRRVYHLSADDEERGAALDFIWFLWCGSLSPLFGKDRMAAFEHYLIDDPAASKETKCAYYKHLDDQDVMKMILSEFGLNPERGHIVNGHVPVKVKIGESPVHAGGRMLLIDGGLSRAYQAVTGGAGYTLIFNSHELKLAAHQPFLSVADAVENETDIHSESITVEKMQQRVLVGDTDNGEIIRERIADLTLLLGAYSTGELKENDSIVK